MKFHVARCWLAAVLLFPLVSHSQVAVLIQVAPPPLLVYAQPVVPGDGYLWSPGYWSWSAQDADYYWVPGTWVMAPEPGQLWTPGYWGYEDSGYRWHGGYWGTTVGYYGGLNYGYGYAGEGYQGGRWNHGEFQYNRAASNVGHAVHGIYSAPVAGGGGGPRTSFNGGVGGSRARPTSSQQRAASQAHTGPTAEQVQHEHLAASTSTQRASLNHGAPPVAATPRPTIFTGAGVEASRARPAANQMHVAAVRPDAMNTKPAMPERAQAPEHERPRAPQPQVVDARPGGTESKPAYSPARGEQRPQARPAEEHPASPQARPAAPVQKAEHEGSREESNHAGR